MSTIPLKLAASWLQRVHTDVKGAAIKAALSAAMLGVRDIQAVIVPGLTPHPPINRGTYLAGWKFQKLDNGARIYNRVYPQAPLIEFGVRAAAIKIGWAMIIALSEWVTMKGIGGGDDVESIAWAIAKSMKKRGIFNQGGTQGFHVIDKAIPGMLREFERKFRQLVDSGAGNGTGGV